MNLKLLSVILFFFVNLSCRNTEIVYVPDAIPVVINLGSKIPHISLIDYVDSLKVINLETNNKSLISEAWGIQRILYVKDKIFLLDGKYMAVKVFDQNGKFLYNIGRLGLGTGEFVRIEDLQYYPERNSLMILCNKPSKIAEYSLEGRLISESKLDFFSTAVAFPSAQSRYYYVNQNKNRNSGSKNLLLTDSSNVIQSTVFDMPKNIHATIKFSGGLYTVNNSIFFNPAFSNTYYSIKNDTIKPAYRVDYGDKNIPTGLKEEILLNNLVKYGFQYNSFVKTNDYVGFNYLDSNVSSAFYNLHSGKILTSDAKLDSLNVLFRNLMFVSGHDYIMVLDTRRMADFMKRNADTIGKRFSVIRPFISQLAANQNPWLLIFKLKSI